MDGQFANTRFSFVAHRIRINDQESVGVTRMGIDFSIHTDTSMPIVLSNAIIGSDDLGRIGIAINAQYRTGSVGDSIDRIVFADNAAVPGRYRSVSKSDKDIQYSMRRARKMKDKLGFGYQQAKKSIEIGNQ